MQTLKTSAIVVLMMTVLYGAYVSMTTPPDPLPTGVESMLVESGMTELPDDFGDFGIDDGTLESAEDLAMNSLDSSSSLGLAEPANASLSFDSLDQNHADVPARTPIEPQQDASFSMSDLDLPATGSSSALPRPEGRLPEVSDTSIGTTISPEPGRDYPSTGTDFELPDPAAAVAMTDEELATDGLELPGSMELPQQSPAKSQAMSSDSSDLDSPANGQAADVAAAGLANAIATADRQYAADRRREALATLSLFYETPNLNSEQREQLLVRLDPLARDVIYSPEHLLEEPYRVGPNETLMDVAQKYDVPWQLLANINSVSDPVTVLPGTDLKVVRGPFRADVDLVNRELTLFLGDLYAGRFPVGIGSDPAPREGTYTIQEKKSAKTYYDLAGTPIPPGNPRNPYGAMWIDLGQGICLHGSPKADRATDDGCISIAGDYSRDVFGILSEGSTVTIR